MLRGLFGGIVIYITVQSCIEHLVAEVDGSEAVTTRVVHIAGKLPVQTGTVIQNALEKSGFTFMAKSITYHGRLQFGFGQICTKVRLHYKRPAKTSSS